MNLENRLIIYQTNNWKIQLRLDQNIETFWVNQQQIADIFDIERSVATKHINKILKEKEISLESNVQKMHIPNSDKPVKLYSLDMILAVWYRTNSSKAIKFRQRATQTLKQHITSWYTINPHRIQHNYQQFLQAVEDIKLLGNQSSNIQKDDIIELIKSFAGTWFTLDAYDKSAIPSSDLTIETLEVEADKLYHDVSLLKHDLMSK